MKRQVVAVLALPIGVILLHHQAVGQHVVFLGNALQSSCKLLNLGSRIFSLVFICYCEQNPFAMQPSRRDVESRAKQSAVLFRQLLPQSRNFEFCLIHPVLDQAKRRCSNRLLGNPRHTHTQTAVYMSMCFQYVSAPYAGIVKNIEHAY